MKNLFKGISFVCLILFSACAPESKPLVQATSNANPEPVGQSANLAWDAPIPDPDPENFVGIAGYRIYMNSGGGVLRPVLDTVAQAGTVTGLDELKQYQFGVTALGDNGSESDMSGTIYWISNSMLAIDRVWGLDLTGTTGWTYAIESTEDLAAPWTQIATVKFDMTGKAVYPVDFSKPMMFFRMKRIAVN
jgi:hypothetical protein